MRNRLLAVLLSAAAVACTSLGAPAGVASAQVLRESAKPWLGIGIEKGPHGVTITQVLAGTPAAGAGLLVGDEVTAIGQTTVKAPPELVEAVQNLGIGTTAEVHFNRAGKGQMLAIKLVARPDQLEVIQKQLTGRPAPGFSLKRISGTSPGSLAELKGKVVILEFWATWCPACRSTHQRLSALLKAHEKEPLAVLAISDEEASTLSAYASQTKPRFTILQDSQHATDAAYFVAAIPELVVIDKKGQVAFVTLGAGDYLEEALAKAESLLKL